MSVREYSMRLLSPLILVLLAVSVVDAQARREQGGDRENNDSSERPTFKDSTKEPKYPFVRLPDDADRIDLFGQFGDDIIFGAEGDRYFLLEPDADLEGLSEEDVEFLTRSETIIQGYLAPDASDVHRQYYRARIEAGAADAVFLTKAPVPLAILDTGIYLEHGDLYGRLTIGKDTIDGGSVDSRRIVISNVDYGAGFFYETHGTALAGVIAGLHGNNRGVDGVCSNADIRVYRCLSGKPALGNIAHACKALDEATKAKVKVILCSWGTKTNSKHLKKALEDAGDAGIVVIAAAGNESTDLDRAKDHELIYPPAWKLDNVIVVAATSDEGAFIDPLSNWGDETVDVAAPGRNIWTTVPTGDDKRTTYEGRSGTSLSAALVAAAVSALLANEPGLAPDDIKTRVRDSASKRFHLRSKVVSGGELNVRELLGFPAAM